MSQLCGGKESVFKDLYWLLKHLFSKNREVCPRCENKTFRHGFIPHERYYCNKCDLWNDNV